jgi:hypothetical protein
MSDDPVVARLADLANRHFNPRGYALHYASLGKGSVDRWFESDGEIAVKRYFYALRPALSVRALRLDPSRRPPMSMQPLMQAAQIDQALTDQIEELIACKAQTNEAGNSIRMLEIERLVVDELDRADQVAERISSESFVQEAEALFLELVEEQ